MIRSSKNLKQSGAAHLFLVIGAVVALVGILGFVGYSVWQKQNSNAGGASTLAPRSGQGVINWAGKCGAGYTAVSPYGTDKKKLGTLRHFASDKKACYILHLNEKYYGKEAEMTVKTYKQSGINKWKDSRKSKTFVGPVYSKCAYATGSITFKGTTENYSLKYDC